MIDNNEIKIPRAVAAYSAMGVTIIIGTLIYVTIAVTNRPEPAHDQGYIERPRELNYKNDCKGYYFGMHKDRLSKRKKSWCDRWCKNS